jgi:hypothetical protein
MTTILMFLLMPLLSSPVAAGFTKDDIWVDTLNTGAAQTVTFSTIGDDLYPDSYPPVATIELDCSAVDTSTSSSYHYYALQVQQVETRTGPIESDYWYTTIEGPTGTDDWTLSVDYTYYPPKAPDNAILKIYVYGFVIDEQTLGFDEDDETWYIEIYPNP